jgi:hypothetical protein
MCEKRCRRSALPPHSKSVKHCAPLLQIRVNPFPPWLNPKTEIRTTDFTDDKRVLFKACASDSSGRFCLQVLAYPRHPCHPWFQLRKSG